MKEKETKNNIWLVPSVLEATTEIIIIIIIIIILIIAETINYQDQSPQRSQICYKLTTSRYLQLHRPSLQQ